MRRLAVVSSTLCALLFPGGAQAWTWPVDGPVLRPFVFGSDPYAGRAAPRDRRRRPASASRCAHRSAGTVSFAGSVPAGGRALTIRTGDGYSVTLLQLGSIAVQRGDEVAEGARVGAVGESADAATREPHVHLGVRRTVDEEGYLDPLAFLPERPPGRAVPAPAARRVAAPGAARSLRPLRHVVEQPAPPPRGSQLRPPAPHRLPRPAAPTWARSPPAASAEPAEAVGGLAVVPRQRPAVASARARRAAGSRSGARTRARPPAARWLRVRSRARRSGGPA